MSDYSKNIVVGANLANEQIELYKNMRDSNYNKIYPWNYIITGNTYNDSGDDFTPGTVYKIENDYAWDFPIKVETVWNDVALLDIDDFDPVKLDTFRLCIDQQNRYVYCPTPNNANLEETQFYRLLVVEEAEVNRQKLIKDENWVAVDDVAYKVTSKVYWTGRRFSETEVSTIVTDWKKF